MRRLALTALLQLPAALALALLILLGSNTLARNGNWISTKPMMAMTLMGAHNFLSTHNATHRNRLDLAAWHGYQEVFLAHPVSPGTDRLSFDLRLDRGGLINVLFNATGSRADGLRLAGTDRRPNAWFTVDSKGRFVAKGRLSTDRRVDDGKWHTIDLRFAGGELEVWIDGALEATRKATLEPGTRIGFRGSLATTVIDDVRLAAGEEVVFRETFFDRAAVVPWTAASLALLSLVTATLVRLGRRRLSAVGQREAEFALIAVHLTLAVVLWIGVAALWAFLGRSYPDRSIGRARDREVFVGEGRALGERFVEQFGAEPPPSTFRILFVGSSQTWGAGAAAAEDAFPFQVERILDERLDQAGRELDVEVLNGAVSALDSRWLIADFYLREWIELSPQLVVVNLSHNDSSRTDAFPRNLEALVRANRARGIATLFVKEARNRDNMASKVDKNHRRMQQVADRLDVPITSAHDLLNRERRNHGFIWWDGIHLTSYGQTLLAQRVAQAIWKLHLADAEADPSARS